MPTAPGVALALGILTDAGMLRPLDEDRADARVRTWRALLAPDMTDQVLAAAVQRLASGDIEVYGAVKPADVNRAAQQVRGERVRRWRERHEPPVGHRSGFQQAAYLRGFLRAIGDGLDEAQADRLGQAALAQAEQVAAAEPGTPLPAILARMDTALGGGRVPWASHLPANSPPEALEAAPDRPDQEPDSRISKVVGNLANGSRIP